MNELHDRIIRFVKNCLKKDEDNYFKFVSFLENNELEQFFQPKLDTLNFSFDIDYLAYEVLKAANDLKVSCKELHNLVEITYNTIKQLKEEEPTIYPVWTGPILENNAIRYKTYETVYQLLKSANEDIFIVGYNFSIRDESIQELISLLEKAAEKNIRITIMVNNTEANFRELIGNWKKERYLLNIYYWKVDDEDPFSSLHSKLIIVDQSKMLLTSANFTYHGFYKNIETGVVIENHPDIRTIWKQYRSLLANKQVFKVFS